MLLFFVPTPTGGNLHYTRRPFLYSEAIIFKHTQIHFGSQRLSSQPTKPTIGMDMYLPKCENLANSQWFKSCANFCVKWTLFT